MVRRFQFYRGPKNSMPVLKEAEPGFTTDEKKLYVGDGTENIGIVKDEDIADMVVTQDGASLVMPSGFTGPSQIIFTEETDEESGGTLYVTITNDGGTYSSSHTLQEIADAVSAEKAVFGVIGDIVVPLTQISTFGGTQTARFDVFSSIDGYKNITLTQSGDALTVSVADSTIAAEKVKYSNTDSGLEASNTQGAIDELCSKKQDKVTGSEGQIVGFDSQGSMVAQDAPVAGVSSFNQRTGAVIPQSGDYTAEMVGAIPETKLGVQSGVATLDNTGKLTESQKPTYTAEEVGARPSTWMPTAEEVGARDDGWMPTAEEVGARPSTWTPTPEEVGAIPLTQKGMASGVAELDSNGKVPSNQLPSYVDDVVEAYVIGSTPYNQDWLSSEPGGSPIAPEAGKIYLVVSDGDYQNQEYRWGGTQYAQISESIALGETQDTAYRGDRGAIAYSHSQLVSGNPHNVNKTDVGLGNVDNTSDANKPISTAQQAALNAKQNKLTGSDGQYVGFDSTGEAVAKDFTNTGLTASEVLAMVYPVGSIYISVNNVNPGTYISGTTWQLYGAGKALVGVDSGDSDFSYAQKTGGTKTSSGSHTHTTAGHSLTKYELPSHEHYMSHSHSDSFSVESGGSHTHLVSLATTNNGDLGSARIFGFGEAPVEGCFSFTNYSPFGQYPTGRQDWGYTSLVFRGGHTHSISGNSNSGGSHSHSLSGSVSTFNGYTAGVGSGGAHDHGNTGSTQVQTSTVQPYITAYFWRRTA